MKNITKNERHSMIQRIIDDGIGDQRHLLQSLRMQGIETTQATISRDLQEMGYAKVRVAPGVYRYEKVEAQMPGLYTEKLQVMFREFVTDIRSTQNQIVIKTLPGNANGVGRVIDEWAGPEVLGTIAGDDTILVIVDSVENRPELEDSLQNFMDGVA
ncbi:arginine repressor [bacterium]|nr:arginine repressor [bacterium]